MSAGPAPTSPGPTTGPSLAFEHPLRRYQRDALDAFDRVRDDRGTRACLVLGDVDPYGLTAQMRTVWRWRDRRAQPEAGVGEARLRPSTA